MFTLQTVQKYRRFIGDALEVTVGEQNNLKLIFSISSLHVLLSFINIVVGNK